MKFRYLGTAAAEGIPALFCCCDICRRSRSAGGPNIRTRSQALIDNRLLIDFPPDTYMHVLRHNIDLLDVKHCLLTHTHSDHFLASDIGMRRIGFAYFENNEPFPLTIHASVKACENVVNVIGEEVLKKSNVVLNPIEAFKPFKVENYTVTAFTSNHDPNAGPVFFAINDGRSTMLYGNDTGYFPEESWEYMARSGLRFDFVSLDCTCAIAGCRDGHMGMEVGQEVRERMIEIGVADDTKTRWCYHHFSHNGKGTHDDLVALAGPKGWLVSYDGMELDI